jgi:hypothetical protein
MRDDQRLEIFGGPSGRNKPILRQLIARMNGREIDGTVCRPEAGTFLYLAAACGGIREVTRSEENNSMC